jgi:hypothetical protein
VSLPEAQSLVVADWIAAYHKYIGEMQHRRETQRPTNLVFDG